MLRIIQNTSAGRAKSYYSTSDYYTQGQELEGFWRGAAANRLGLSGIIKKTIGMRCAIIAIQRRVDEESLAGLAQSIKKTETLHPILVRREGSELIPIEGERRLRVRRTQTALAQIPETPASRFHSASQHEFDTGVGQRTSLLKEAFQIV
jgi:hypothetical protein